MDEVNIVEYDPRWQTWFAQEAECIWQALGNNFNRRFDKILNSCNLINPVEQTANYVCRSAASGCSEIDFGFNS